MKIVLIFGKSGSGKTSVTEGLKLKYPSVFNIIESYTDRPVRYMGETGHIFISRDEMLGLLGGDGVVASTNFGGFNYCSTVDQFIDGVVNLYIVDENGVRDVKSFIKDNGLSVDLLVVEVRRSVINVSSDRVLRDKPFGVVGDRVLVNDGDLEWVVDELFDLIFNYFYWLCF